MFSYWYRRVRSRLVRCVFDVVVRPIDGTAVVTFGKGAGRWRVPAALLPNPACCFLAGVGDDTQLDEALLELGHEVFAFDPTPRAIEQASRVKKRYPGYQFEAVGLWKVDGVQNFFAPTLATRDVSHSIKNLQRSDKYFVGPVERLSTILRRHGRSNIDLLKLDIEGAEHEVIADMVACEIWPGVLCFEIDQPAKVRDIRTTLRLLRAHGYELVDTDKWNTTWIRKPEGASR